MKSRGKMDKAAALVAIANNVDFFPFFCLQLQMNKITDVFLLGTVQIFSGLL